MIFELLLAISVIVAIIAVEMKDLLYSVILLAVLETTLAALFYLMAAPDIAITQVAVCAGISTFIFIIAINKTERKEI